jgi:hypothetical protein
VEYRKRKERKENRREQPTPLAQPGAPIPSPSPPRALSPLSRTGQSGPFPFPGPSSRAALSASFLPARAAPRPTPPSAAARPRALLSCFSLTARPHLSSLSSGAPPATAARSPAGILGLSLRHNRARDSWPALLSPGAFPWTHSPPAQPPANPNRAATPPPLGSELRRHGCATPLRPSSGRDSQELHPTTRNLPVTAIFFSGPRSGRSTELAAGPVVRRASGHFRPW